MCSVPWGGGVQYCGGYHKYRGGYPEYCGNAQYCGGYHDARGGVQYRGGTQITRDCMPHGTEHPHSTHDIHHSTEYAHGTQDITHGTEHTSYRVVTKTSLTGHLELKR